MRDPKWTEIKKSSSKAYYIRGSWEARVETPEELAARFLRLIDALKRVDPVFNLWTCGAKRPKKFEMVRDSYAKEIAAGISRDDWGEPTSEEGYWFGAFTRDTPDNRTFAVRCHAGATVETDFPNGITFTTSSLAKPEPDPDIISYRVFRSALLAIVDAWEPLRAGAYSQQLIQMNVNASWFPKAWIQYLCPWLARKIVPPSTALVEHLPNGGLLMSATTETFNVSNPKHLAVATEIAAAMAPLDQLPWPSES